jgi:ubiquinol-cytochrome c reductase iron-sulfur subunit
LTLVYFVPNLEQNSQSTTSAHSASTTSTPKRTMASLTTCSRALLRSIPRTHLNSVRALSTSSVQKRASATETPSSSFDSPFRGLGGGDDKGSQIPDFSHYRSSSSKNSNLVFQYFMVGTMGALTAAGAKATVQGMLRTIDADPSPNSFNVV